MTTSCKSFCRDALLAFLEVNNVERSENLVLLTIIIVKYLANYEL